MKTATALIVTVLAAIVFAIVGIIAWSVGRGAVAAPATSMLTRTASTVPVHVFLTVATPAMLNSDVGPAVLPSKVTVPANTDVTVTIINFDDSTPLTGRYISFATASGINGKFTTQGMDPADPNGPPTSPAQTVSAIDPNVVSHTFTIPSLKLNVPLMPKSNTTFTFRTGAPGIYEWHCQDPCGTGPSGWSGAMSQQGFMGGRLTVA
jgi:hypothetical protein